MEVGLAIGSHSQRAFWILPPCVLLDLSPDIRFLDERRGVSEVALRWDDVWRVAGVAMVVSP